MLISRPRVDCCSLTHLVHDTVRFPVAKPGASFATMERAYVYEELPRTTSIRLLQLLPGYRSEPIWCSFTISSVTLGLEEAKQPVPCEAISYVCGNATGLEPIICEGAVLRVPKTLVAVLNRFRLLDHSRTLWVDAACINQSCSHEKNHQVQIMDAIFRQAKQVLFCLGTVEQWSEEPGDMYRDGYKDSGFMTNILTLKLKECSAEHRSFVYAKTYAGKMPHTLKTEHFAGVSTFSQWQYVKDILDVPWFRRAWVGDPKCKCVWHHL
jgi:hypothetical protein